MGAEKAYSFGIISQNTKITIVMTITNNAIIIEVLAAPNSKSLSCIHLSMLSVAIDVADMFTSVFANSVVINNCLGFSNNLKIRLELVLLSFSNIFICILVKEKNAVSAKENNAEMITSKNIIPNNVFKSSTVILILLNS